MLNSTWQLTHQLGPILPHEVNLLIVLENTGKWHQLIRKCFQFPTL